MESFSKASDEVGAASASAGSAETLAEDEAIDFITGNKVKLKGNEEVRQQVARALYVEYGIRVQDMQRDFAESVLGQQQDDYPVFMAVAEKVGIDRRGNPVYKRRPDGEVILEPHVDRRAIPVRGRERDVAVTRMVKAVDNDLAEIAKAYKAFREKYPEPPGHKQ